MYTSPADNSQEYTDPDLAELDAILASYANDNTAPKTRAQSPQPDCDIDDFSDLLTPEFLSIEREKSRSVKERFPSPLQEIIRNIGKPAPVHLSSTPSRTPTSPTQTPSSTTSTPSSTTPLTTPTQSTKNSGAASLTVTTTSTTPAGRKVRTTITASVGATPWRTFNDDQVFRLACRNVAARGGLAVSLNFSPAIARKTILAACPATFIAGRINAELRKIGHTANELGFRFEVSDTNKLHLHGFALFDELTVPAQITAALRRAGGKLTGPALSTQTDARDLYDADGWTSYVTKSADRRRAEALLSGKALSYVSRAARAAAKAAHEGLRAKTTRTRRTVPAPVPAPATPAHAPAPALATPHKAPPRPAMRMAAIQAPKTHNSPLRPSCAAPVQALSRTVCMHRQTRTGRRDIKPPMNAPWRSSG